MTTSSTIVQQQQIPTSSQAAFAMRAVYQKAGFSVETALLYLSRLEREMYSRRPAKNILITEKFMAVYNKINYSPSYAKDLLESLVICPETLEYLDSKHIPPHTTANLAHCNEFLTRPIPEQMAIVDQVSKYMPTTKGRYIHKDKIIEIVTKYSPSPAELAAQLAQSQKRVKVLEAALKEARKRLGEAYDSLQNL